MSFEASVPEVIRRVGFSWESFNWEAFGGITQLISALATAAAVFVALYQIQKQYKTKLKITIIPKLPEQRADLLWNFAIDVKISNISAANNAYIKRVALNFGKKTTNYVLQNEKEEITPGQSLVCTLQNAWMLGKEATENSYLNLIATIIMSDGSVYATKYLYFKQWIHLFNKREEDNKKNKNYLMQITQLKERNERARKSAIDAYNVSVTGSFFDEATRFELIRFKIKKWLVNDFPNSRLIRLALGTIILSLVFAICFFAVVGIVYYFSS